VNVLAIGAHPDDIELGCGAALINHRRGGHPVTLLVMTTGERGPQAARSRVQEQEDAAALLGADLMWGHFVDGEVPDGRQSVEVIEAALAASGADVVYTHAPSDSHQDHRATSAATLAACRRLSTVLMYESPTSLGFSPTVFVDAHGLVEAKLNLLRAHVSQVLKNGLVDLEAVESQARYRGFQARVRNAEGFAVDRIRWEPAPGADVDIDLALAEVSA
jgi:LmbE family N-acetylglucosaminyl deacetylase